MQDSPFDSPFRKFHAEAGATLAESNGWSMPQHYPSGEPNGEGSARLEHAQCRASGAIFDVSHLGRLRLSGRHARKLLETALTRKVTDMALRTCREAVVCSEAGAVIDVVSVYRYENEWLLVTNAAARAAVHAHLDALIEADGMSVKLIDETEKTAMLSVQGPKVVAKIGEFSREIPTLKPWTFAIKNLLILKMTVSRTGYTGGDGVEVLLGANMASMAIKLLLKDKSEAAAIKPAGLLARESLRIEAGLPAYGAEFGDGIDADPLSLGLAHAVDLDKHLDDSGVPVPRFVGQDALERIAAAGPVKKLIRLALAGGPPAAGSEVAGGHVTSATALPGGESVALAMVDPGTAPVDGDTVDVAGTTATAAAFV